MNRLDNSIHPAGGSDPIVQAALLYASRGWHVFPCHPNDKRPLIKSAVKGEGGYKLASADPAQIRAWWKSWPDAMIGVATGQGIGSVVLDIDPKDGKPPEAMLREIRELIGCALPPAPMVRTPRGGLHLWFAIPPDRHVGNRAGIIPGVDLRGEGTGYVILPPSVRRGPKAVRDGCDGVAYSWVEDAGLADFSPPAAPEPLLRFFTEKKAINSTEGHSGQRSGAAPASTVALPQEGDPRAAAVRRFALSALDLEVQKVAQAPHGQRNSTLNNSAIALGELVAAGALSQAVVVADLERAAGQNGLVKEDGIRGVRATIESGMRKGLSQPRDLSQVGLKARQSAGRRPRATSSDGQDTISRRSVDGDLAQGEAESDAEGPNNLLLSRHPRSDLGNASRLIARFGNDLMFVENVGWHVWDGRRWSSASGGHKAQKLAHHTSERIRDEADAMQEAGPYPGEAPKDFEVRIAAHRKYSISSGNSGKIDGMLRQAEPDLLRRADELDSHDYIITLNNVTIDLVAPCFDGAAADDAEAPTVQEGAHRRELLSTRAAAVDYDPKASCRRFLAWLEEILPDPEVRLFMQRWFGYCLTGDTSEQSLLCCHGSGSNGKSTLLEVLGEILGDYTVTVPIETFLHDDRRSGAQATPDIARLPGARLVLAAEPEAGARLSESTVKRITGGEKINARRLFEDQFEFVPKFKLVITFNAKPTIRGLDDGIWRRLLMVMFNTFIPAHKRDRHLKQKLLTERAGIFNWMLDGHREWREKGLSPPEAVLAATEAYRSDSDPIGQFMDQMTVRTPPSEGKFIGAADLYTAYQSWCGANGVEPVSKNLLGRRLGDKGYTREKFGGFNVYLNLQLSGLERQSNGLED